MIKVYISWSLDQWGHHRWDIHTAMQNVLSLAWAQKETGKADRKRLTLRDYPGKGHVGSQCRRWLRLNGRFQRSRPEPEFNSGEAYSSKKT